MAAAARYALPDFPSNAVCGPVRCVTNALTFKRACNGKSFRGAPVLAAVATGVCVLTTAAPDREILVVDLMQSGLAAQDVSVQVAAAFRTHLASSNAAAGLPLAFVAPQRAERELRKAAADVCDLHLSPCGSLALLVLQQPGGGYSVCLLRTANLRCEAVPALMDIRVTAVCWGVCGGARKGAPVGTGAAESGGLEWGPVGDDVLVGTDKGGVYVWRRSLGVLRKAAQLPANPVKSIVAGYSSEDNIVSILVSSSTRLHHFTADGTLDLLTAPFTTAAGALTTLTAAAVASAQIFEMPEAPGGGHDAFVGEVLVDDPINASTAHSTLPAYGTSNGAHGTGTASPPRVTFDRVVWWLTRCGVGICNWTVADRNASVSTPLLLGFQLRPNRRRHRQEFASTRPIFDSNLLTPPKQPFFHRIYATLAPAPPTRMKLRPSSDVTTYAPASLAAFANAVAASGETLPSVSELYLNREEGPPAAISFALSRSFLLLLYEDRLALCSRITRQEESHVALPPLQYGTPRRLLKGGKTGQSEESMVLLVTSRHLFRVEVREQRALILRDLMRVNDYATAMMTAASDAAAIDDHSPELLADAIRAEFAGSRFAAGAYEDAAKLYAASPSVCLEEVVLRFSTVPGHRRTFLLLSLLESCKNALRLVRRQKALTAAQVQASQLALRLWQMCLALGGCCENRYTAQWLDRVLRGNTDDMDYLAAHRRLYGLEDLKARQQKVQLQQQRFTNLITALQQEIGGLVLLEGEQAGALMSPLRLLFRRYGAIPETARFLSFVGDVEEYVSHGLFVGDSDTAYASIARLPTDAAQVQVLSRFGGLLLRLSPPKFSALLIAPEVLQKRRKAEALAEKDAEREAEREAAAGLSADNPLRHLPHVTAETLARRSPLWELLLKTGRRSSFASVLAVILAEPASLPPRQQNAAYTSVIETVLFLLRKLLTGSHPEAGLHPASFETTAAAAAAVPSVSGYWDGVSALWNLYLNLSVTHESEEALIEALHLLDQRRMSRTIDFPMLLRAAMSQRKFHAAAFLLSNAGFHVQSVELALQHNDRKLALESVKKLPSTVSQMLRNSLWKKIAAAFQSDEDFESLRSTLSSDGNNALHGLPVFLRSKGAAAMSQCKDSICETFRQVEALILQRVNEMERNRATLKRLRAGLLRQRSRPFASVTAKSQCLYCRLPAVADRFYSFPCGHICHCTCAHMLKLPTLIGTKKQKYIEAVKRLSAVILGQDTVTDLRAVEADVDRVLAEECFICGQDAVSRIALPFLTAGEACS